MAGLRVLTVTAIFLGLIYTRDCTPVSVFLQREQFAGTHHKDVVKKLFDMTEHEHVQYDHNFFLPPFFWKEKKGVYKSGVKLNFHGDPIMAAMREEFRVFDNNMFVTAWITSCLIESYQYGNAPKPSSKILTSSVAAIRDFHDKNLPEQPNAIMTFWPETFNQSVAAWQSTPGNLLSLFKLADYFPWTFLEKVLQFLGFSKEANEIKEFLGVRSTLTKAFRIPPDFDDTFVNLGLGSLLTEHRADFAEAHGIWAAENTNLEGVWAAVKRFAYRPFSGDRDVNTVDPRSYFYLRGFLQEANNTGQDVALIPTWVQDLGGNRNMSHRGVSMPFNVNNVDVAVCANAVYGMTSAVTSGLVNVTLLSDPDLQKIYLNTSAMLVWEIENDFAGRTDLALSYYPSLFEFYWFVSRTFALLERYTLKHNSTPEVLEIVRQQFGLVLRGHVTDVIIKQAQQEGELGVFFDDFLGNGDRDLEGKPVIRGEDRIFTTAMAVNTLVNTWAVFDHVTRQIQWVKDAPSVVKGMIKKASLWLTENTLSGRYKPWNAFFSGSAKGDDALPFWYPINRLEYLNGTKIPLNSSTFSDEVMLGIEGLVSEEEYQVLLNETHFGRRTPTVFKGYNAGNDTFPFWSSNGYTYVTAMLALTQTQSLASSDPIYNVIPDF